MWDTLILNPMTNLLLLLYQFFFHNFALSVAVFTIITRLITLPFTMQQQRSAKAMQELQPELEQMKKKYVNDREKQSQAQMELYRKHKISPLGGCLPMLLTLPIMFGLYQAIMTSLAATPLQLLELSQRLYPFLPGLNQLIPLDNKWLGINLGQPPGATQPWYAYGLIALVVVTGYIQQKMMSPKTAPASQGQNQMAGMTQSMQYTMPLMFGFFALSFAAGLSIYFIISNLVGMLQYWAMDKLGMMGPAKTAVGKTAEPTVAAAPPKQSSPPKPASASKPAATSKPAAAKKRRVKRSA
jgi:YidC/Oxa1 family membrane protein insertase